MKRSDDDKRDKRWSDLFGSIDEEFEEMRENMNRLMERLMTGTPAFDGEPMTYGFSMKIDSNGKPRIQHFGNTRAEEEATPTREPLTDVIEEEDKVRVVMELPGVRKDDIRLHATAKVLDIDVETENRKFSKHLDLPCEVKGGSARATYKNGVLQIVLQKSPKKRKREIKIE